MKRPILITIVISVILNVQPSLAQWSDNGSSITTNDNLGVKTSNPTRELHVIGDALIESTSGAELNLLNISSGKEWQVVSGFNGGFEIGNTTDGLTDALAPFFISPDGNLGLGTHAPERLLHLKNNDYRQLVFDRRENANVDDLFLIGPSWGSEGGNYDGLYFTSSGTGNVMFLQANGGYVGIGTKNPSNRLTVNGTVNAEEIIVEENIGADFVFLNDYQLPTLSEVEQHIKTKKHLPEIPTAEEMKRDGVKVGELQIKLLQKIEELTLYVIGLEKQLSQSKTINDLQGMKLELLEKQLKKADEGHDE